MRNPIGDRLAAEALEWVGTPTHWGQSAKGVGCDCKGLVQGVFRECGRPEAASFYGLFVAYRGDRPVPCTLLKKGLAELFDRVDDLPRENGDILLLEIRRKPSHLAIVTHDGARAVHADAWSGERVKDRRLDALLTLRPLNSAWRVRRGG